MLSKVKNVRHTRTLVNRCCNCQSVCIVSIYICYAFPQINQIAFSSRSQMAVVFIQRKWYIKTVEMINLARALRGTFSHISLHKEKRRNGFYVHHMKVHQKFNCNQLINFSKSNRKNANIFNCMRQKARVTDCMRQKARVTDFSELTHSISIKIKAKRDLGLTTLRLEWNDNKLKTGQKPFMKYFFVS